MSPRITIGVSLLLVVLALWDYGVEVRFRWRNLRREGRRASWHNLLVLVGLLEEELPTYHIAKPATVLRQRHVREVEAVRRTWSEGRVNNPPVPSPRDPDA